MTDKQREQMNHIGQVELVERVGFYENRYDNKLKELRDMLRAGDKQSVSHCRKYKINVNSYVPGNVKTLWMPLLHYACLKRENQKFVSYCLTHHVDLAALPDKILQPGDGSEHSAKVHDLPYVCHPIYLKELHKRGIVFHLNETSVMARLNIADHQRLVVMMQIGMFNTEDLVELLSSQDVSEGYGSRQDSSGCNVYDAILETMLNYMQYAFNIREQENLNKTVLTNQTIAKYCDTLQFLLELGLPVSHTFTDRCVEYYLFEFIAVLNAHDHPVAHGDELKYHTQMNSTVVALLRPLLNDYRYEQTCLTLSVEPDPDLYLNIT